MANASLRHQLFEKLDQKCDQMVAIRRYLHENPELSLKRQKQQLIFQIFIKVRTVMFRHNLVV